MFGKYIDFIEKNMDVASIKRNVISDNIANYSTPDFKASKLSFDKFFDQGGELELKGTYGKHITQDSENGKIDIFQETGGKERLDGNNVDLNVEMLDMIKNNSYYTQAVQAINKEFYLNKKAIGN